MLSNIFGCSLPQPVIAELSQNPLQTQPATEHNELPKPICKVFTDKHLIKRQKLKLHFASGAGDVSRLRSSSPGGQTHTIGELARSLHGGVRRARSPRSGKA